MRNRSGSSGSFCSTSSTAEENEEIDQENRNDRKSLLRRESTGEFNKQVIEDFGVFTLEDA